MIAKILEGDERVGGVRGGFADQRVLQTQCGVLAISGIFVIREAAALGLRPPIQCQMADQRP
jgi:hypothetical protein